MQPPSQNADNPQAPGLVQRVFVPGSSRLRLVGDLALGVVIPSVCLAADPFVFRADDVIPGIQALGHLRFFAYTAFALGSLALVVWLVAGPRIIRRAPLLAALFSGIFSIGTLFAIGLAIFILPYSLVGLVICVGVLGFVPFLTAFVYLRHAVIAFREVRRVVSLPRLVFTGILGACLVLVPPTMVHTYTEGLVSNSINQILTGTPEQVQAAIQTLRGYDWCTRSCFGKLVTEYRSATDEQRRAIIQAAYKELTGFEIDDSRFFD